MKALGLLAAGLWFCMACRGPTFQIIIDSDDDEDGETSGGGSGGGGAGAGAASPGESCTFVDGAVVSDDCGVFVSPGATGGDGTKAKPLASVAEAIESRATSIYVCGDKLVEAVSLPPALALYGGFDCGAWTFEEASRTEITAGAEVVPLTLLGGGGAVVEGFVVRASGGVGPSSSSIAMIADQATATLRRVDFVSGNAQPGLGGTPGDPGTPGNPGSSTTSASSALGGTSSCNAKGGRGGSAASQDEPGDAGEPSSQDNGGDAGCTAGGQGDTGGTGDAGDDSSGFGTISIAGFTPPAIGSNGEPGASGGGGGGGGSKIATPRGGAGGGAGGCGGTPGTPGTSGGSSIAIVSLDAGLTFVDCTATVGDGGDGGSGGPGGPGGDGGMPGSGACSGGKGGKGGDGGRGGHGAGGHSLIVAFVGDAPDLDGLVFSAPAAEQAGESDAQPGLAQVALGFDTQ
ncbi:MAG: hypothetical protein HOW73_30380 [Polyangiaceae bacterium]|nr:hypothetical protein [Polyangiaceae bacterium]